MRIEGVTESQIHFVLFIHRLFFNLDTILSSNVAVGKLDPFCVAGLPSPIVSTMPFLPETIICFTDHCR